MPFNMKEVKSSAVSHVGYDPATQTLRITYTSGKSYDYPETSTDDYEALLHAESVGKHINTMFAARKSKKVDPEAQA